MGTEVKNITDEIPFEIPENWAWGRFSLISKINGGFAFKSENYTTKEKGVRVLRISDFDESGIKNHKMVFHPFNQSMQEFLLEDKDIVMCMTGGTVGKTLLITSLDEQMLVNQRVAAIKINNKISNDYIYVFLTSYFVKDIIKSEKNSTNDNISMDLIKSFLLPLPPLTEQERIVAEIEKYEPLIAEYDKLEQQSTKLDNEIKDKLKKSILQYAIEGKLVQQNPDDEPASVLLEKIRAEKKAQLGKKYVDSYIYKGDDNCYYEHANGKDINITKEIPFDLPRNWSWSRLNGLINIISDGTHKTPNYVDKGIPFLSVQNISSGKLDLSKLKHISNEEHLQLIKRVKPQLNDILFCRIGTLGKAIKITWDFEFSIFVSLGLIRTVYPQIIDYLIFLLNSPFGDKWIDENKVGGGTHTFKINLNSIPQMLIPLPPLAEQERIVNRINEIFEKL